MEMRSLIRLLLVIFAVITTIWVACGGLCEVCKINGKNMESLAAWFSGLAFAGMIVAIVLQSKELALQRQELADTRAELKRTAEANEKSADLSHKNIIQQKQISETANSYLQCQILTQIYIARINAILKIRELGIENNQNPEDNKKVIKIKSLLTKLEQLETLDGPISEDKTATPEA